MKKEWRCTGCGKLLAIIRGNRLHVRFARGHEYLVGFPVTGVCRNCRTLNELLGDNRETDPEGSDSGTFTN